MMTLPYGKYQLRQVPRVWDEPTLSLDRLP